MSAKTCILIADDEALNHLFYREILDIDKYDIIFVENGREAIEEFNNNSTRISIILMDMKMPEMDGYTATEEIRKINQTVPILAQTAYAFKEDIDKALKCGCNDYISKPIHEKILLNKIETLINS